MPDALPRPRRWDLDALRGLAVVLMVFYHFMWDLSFFDIYPGSVTVGWWKLFARSIATLFLLVLGASVYLMRTRRNVDAAKTGWIRRGLRVMAWGMVITLVTWALVPERAVVFGILHLIAVALLLAPTFVSWSDRWLVGVGLAVVILGQGINRIPTDTTWLVPLGVVPPEYPAVDYFPLFPWLGVVLLGVALGRLGLATDRWPFPTGAPPVGIIRPLCFLGRHALVVYLIHQPLLLGLLAGLGYIPWQGGP